MKAMSEDLLRILIGIVILILVLLLVIAFVTKASGGDLAGSVPSIGSSTSTETPSGITITGSGGDIVVK